MAHRIALAAAAVLALSVLAGCGVKGPLEPPPSAVSAEPDEIIDSTETTQPERTTSVLDRLLQ